MFDLLIKGGRLIDPATNCDDRLDIAVRRGRVAAVDRDIPASAAANVVDATDRIITPGLVDLHTHVYHGVTYWGIRADPVAARTGVTTWLDAGSAGAFNVIGFREFIAGPAQARLYALLNISAIGLTASTGELRNLDYCDEKLCVKLANANRDIILGIKARVDRNTTGGGELEGLRRARRAADETGMPLMVHIGHAPPDVADVLAFMRPGDVLTHCCTGGTMRIFGADGSILDAARRAWDAGVVLDIGHGAGSFSFDSAEALLRTGRLPDVISSDVHQLSVLGPMFDLPTCLSKFMALGVSLPDVVRAATLRPAEVMGLAGDIGTLAVGARADIALFRLIERDVTLYDTSMASRTGRSLLVNTLTIVGGRPMAVQPDREPAPWIELSEAQRGLISQGHTPAAYGRR